MILENIATAFAPSMAQRTSQTWQDSLQIEQICFSSRGNGLLF
jgi:hypothetical protein